ncbi:S9 family peptidase [Isoptericola sp. 178]|uniref:alpha/beta hydrolase family protein n=1 Tax=Isoptericola sp. 178 TaxID=3064651 RepID=UPI0027126673|nr:prolyl oligopeptidase family serine peptidase [Isoptericola sp. 178]MDO8145339.1 prolyl oligopeptidase family serine peptidase [Isoptericola sp. 178]
MVFRTFAASLALLVGLAVVGSLAGPQWHPVPVRDHIVPTRVDTTIESNDPVSLADAGQVGDHEVRSTVVPVDLGDTTVEGLLRRPVDEDGTLLEDRPGVVFVHGAGTGRAQEAFVRTARMLASAGIVTLVPDKRLDTYSTRERDYEAMAEDYLRSVDLLRTVEGVDPARVGAYGESEGTWIVPVMQVDDPTLAFTVLVSAPVVPPREQAAFAVDNYLRNTGVPGQVFRAIPRAVGMQLPGGGFDYADFDVRPWLEQQTAPILVVYGTADPSMPIEQGVRLILADTGVGTDAPVTVRYYAGADHGIRLRGEQSTDGAGSPLHPDFPRDLAAWIQGLPGTADAAPRVAGDSPEQLYLAAPVPRPQWWGNGDVVVAVVVAGTGLVVLALVAWGVAALAHRLLHRPAPHGGRFAPGVGPPLVVLGVVSVATVVGLALYLAAVARLAVDYERDALVVQGGWITVRVLGVVAAVAAAVLLRRVGDVRVHRRADRDVAVAHGAVAHVTLWAVVLGSALLLVTAAYWGVYQLGI